MFQFLALLPVLFLLVTADEVRDKLMAMQITTVFENSVTDFQYEYVENLNDGRGYTCGIVGFCTGTGDAYLVIKRYTSMVPNNPLSKYLPLLQTRSDGRVDDLVGYPEGWKQSARDEKFKVAQLEVADELYWRPAVEVAKEQGVVSALGKTLFYDTAVQHGNGEDEDSLRGVLKKMTKTIGDGEKAYLTDFNRARKYVLTHATNEETRKVWSESTGRVDALQYLVDKENFELRAPVMFDTPLYPNQRIPEPDAGLMELIKNIGKNIPPNMPPNIPPNIPPSSGNNGEPAGKPSSHPKGNDKKGPVNRVTQNIPNSSTPTKIYTSIIPIIHAIFNIV